MGFDPFNVLPVKKTVIATELPFVFRATNPIVQALPVSTIPASITSTGNNGNNTPTNLGEEMQRELTRRREGRMSLFTAEKAVEVVEGVEDGQTMDQIAAFIGVTRKTIWTWLQLSPEFCDAVACAREYQGHASADDAVNILDNVDLTNEDSKQNMAALRKAEQRARIRMQLAECFNFRQYGKKQHNLITSVNVTISPVDLSKYS